MHAPAKVEYSEWRSGGPAVFAASIGFGATGGMLLLTAGLFVQPMRAEFGWSTSAATIAPIMMFVISFSLPLAGLAVDRWGSRRAAIIGTLCVAAGMLALAAAPNDRRVVYGTAIALAATSALCSNVTFARGVATWFRRNIGLALGLTLSGSSIVTFFILPVLAAIIADKGWRAGYVSLAGLVLVAGLVPIVLLFRERDVPPPAGPLQERLHGTSLAEALRSRSFWTLLLSMLLAALPLGAFLTNHQPILLGAGFSTTAAASLGMFYVGSIMVGRIAGGFLLDQTDPRIVPVAMFLLAGSGAAALSVVDAGSAYALVAVALVLIGMGQGAESDFIAFFTARLFGTRAYSAILGIYAMAVGVGMAVGGMACAVAYDAMGTFVPAMRVGGALFVLAALVTATMPRGFGAAPR